VQREDRAGTAGGGGEGGAGSAVAPGGQGADGALVSGYVSDAGAQGGKAVMMKRSCTEAMMKVCVKGEGVRATGNVVTGATSLGVNVLVTSILLHTDCVCVIDTRTTIPYHSTQYSPLCGPPPLRPTCPHLDLPVFTGSAARNPQDARKEPSA
jgi:hypothetical protein